VATVPARSERPPGSFVGLEIDLVRRELRLDGVPVPIGSRAFEIMQVLIEAAGGVTTKDDLISRVWPDAMVEENTLHGHISAIRHVLGPHRAVLQTVPRRGYRLLGNWTVHRQVAPHDPSIGEPTPRPDQTFQTNLPLAFADLIGRGAEVQHLQTLLATARTVTLTGPGGVGKTVLAQDVARRLLLTFQADTWLVELDALSDPAQLPATVASALALPSPATDISAQALAQAIAGTPVLLLLDTCEHLIDAVAEMVETILQTCPRASIVATSRECLRIEGECVYRVAALDVPPHDATDPADLLQHSAVQLFVARIQSLRPDFLPDPQGLVAIAEICRRLDALPLAIELAAARAALLGPDQVLSRLDDPFALLTGGRRTAPPRHQTLRASLDWSYTLLSESERRVLRRLSNFPTGFTLDAATAVMRETGGTEFSVLEDIGNLVAKSLVSFDGPEPSDRWRLPETVRAYAREKLAESGETVSVG
jgi:non-specific serine/threonine protein kinase